MLPPTLMEPVASRPRSLAGALAAVLLAAAYLVGCAAPTEEAPFGEDPFGEGAPAGDRGWLWEATGEESAWEAVKGVGALAWLRATGPRLELAPDAPIDHLGHNPYGVNAFLQLEADPEVVRRSLALLRDAGIGWVRQQFPWEDIEIHARGDFEDRRNEPARSAWDKYDRLVKLAGEYGIRLLVRLDDPPDWAYAEDEPRGHRGPPSDTADYARFVATVGERYCGQVRYYQLWNEPNIYPEWGERDVDPAGYAALLHEAAAALRAACPDAVVVSAAMAQTTEVGGRNMDDLRYLEALYDAGWQDDFDVLAVQGFGLWTGPTDRRVSPDRANFNRLLLARDLMVRRGDAEKAMWITEMGWDSPPLDLDAPFGRVTEEVRAEYTVRAFQRMAEEWPFVGVGFVWHFRRPDREWHARPEGWFRLVEPEWDEAPAFVALRERATGLPVLHRGRHEVDDHALERFGAWRLEPPEGDGPARQAIGFPGAELTARFDGTSIALRLLPGEPVTGTREGEGPDPDAYATTPLGASRSPTATLGSTASATTTLGSATPATTTLYVVLDGASQAVELPPGAEAWRSPVLDDGPHRLSVRVDAGQLLLDEVVVAAPDPPDPLMPLYAALGAALALLLALALLALWWRRRGRAAGSDSAIAAAGDEPGAAGPGG